MNDISNTQSLRPGANQVQTVIFSRSGDLYRVATAASAKPFWLSVAPVAAPPGPRPAPRPPYLGLVNCADGWRQAYALDWSVVQPGITRTLPDNDILVAAYLNATLGENS